MSKNKARKNRNAPPVTAEALAEELPRTRRYSVLVGTWLALAFGVGALILSGAAIYLYSVSSSMQMVWVFAPVMPLVGGTIILYIASQRPVYAHATDKLVMTSKSVSTKSEHSSDAGGLSKVVEIMGRVEKTPTGPTQIVAS